MPSTRYLVSRLKMQAEGWNRTGERGLLEVLNEAQDLLYCQPTHQTIAYTSSGALPNITTTDSTYSYTLSQANTGLSDDVWRCGAVLVKPPFSNQLLAAIRVEYGITPNLRQPVKPMQFNGVEYFRFFEVATQDAERGGDPTLVFTTNPGATTTDFYLLLYKKPTELTAESVACTLPEQLHIPYLLPAAMKLVEGYQNGSIIESLTYIEEYIKPKVRNALNQGDQGIYYSATRHEE